MNTCLLSKGTGDEIEEYEKFRNANAEDCSSLAACLVELLWLQEPASRSIPPNELCLTRDSIMRRIRKISFRNTSDKKPAVVESPPRIEISSKESNNKSTTLDDKVSTGNIDGKIDSYKYMQDSDRSDDKENQSVNLDVLDNIGCNIIVKNTPNKMYSRKILLDKNNLIRKKQAKNIMASEISKENNIDSIKIKRDINSSGNQIMNTKGESKKISDYKKDIVVKQNYTSDSSNFCYSTDFIISPIIEESDYKEHSEIVDNYVMSSPEDKNYKGMTFTPKIDISELVLRSDRKKKTKKIPMKRIYKSKTFLEESLQSDTNIENPNTLTGSVTKKSSLNKFIDSGKENIIPKNKNNSIIDGIKVATDKSKSKKRSFKDNLCKKGMLKLPM